MAKSKRKKASLAQKRVDRLSSLPDHILCRILSFAPTKYVVRTSVLSTRWREIFSEVPKIVVDEPWFSTTTADENSDFFGHLFERIGYSSLNEFQLNFPARPIAHVVIFWIRSVVLLTRSEFKVIRMEMPEHDRFDGGPLDAPCDLLFRWKSLVVLKLHGRDVEIKVPEHVFLPNLKTLDLKYLAVQSDSLRIHEEGYPLLEDLRLSDIRFPSEFESIQVTVSLPALKNLVLQLSIPGLELSLAEFKSLSSAIISVESISFSGPREGYLKVLRRIFNVRELSFDSKDYIMEPNRLPLFPNLIHLDLIGGSDSMHVLLQRALNLESLVWQMGDVEMSEWSRGVVNLENLKEITLKRFPVGWFEAVKFFLKHGTVLGKMIIEVPFYEPIDAMWRSSVLTKINGLERASPKCKTGLRGLRTTSPPPSMFLASPTL